MEEEMEMATFVKLEEGFEVIMKITELKKPLVMRYPSANTWKEVFKRVSYTIKKFEYKGE